MITPIRVGDKQQFDYRPDTVVIPQQREWREVVLLIASGWDIQRHEVLIRPLLITRLPNQYGQVVDYVIRIDGSPERGVVLVSARYCFDPVIFPYRHRRRSIEGKHAVQIRQLAFELANNAWPPIGERP